MLSRLAVFIVRTPPSSFWSAWALFLPPSYCVCVPGLEVSVPRVETDPAFDWLVGWVWNSCVVGGWLMGMPLSVFCLILQFATKWCSVLWHIHLPSAPKFTMMTLRVFQNGKSKSVGFYHGGGGMLVFKCSCYRMGGGGGGGGIMHSLAITTTVVVL